MNSTIHDATLEVFSSDLPLSFLKSLEVRALEPHEGSVPEQVLSVAEVGVVLHEVGGTGVPPHVGCDVLGDLGDLRMLCHQRAQHVRIDEPPSVGTKEQVRVVPAELP